MEYPLTPELYANEPDDYDGYVDYVCDRTPGLDGVTYADGTTVADPEPEG